MQRKKMLILSYGFGFLSALLCAGIAACAGRALEDQHWGLLTAPAAESDDATESLVGNLTDYTWKGLATVATTIPASDDNGQPTFSADGKEMNPAVEERLRRIISECKYRSMEVVLTLFEDRPGAVLQNEEAWINAARLATKNFGDHRQRVIFTITRPHPDPQWMASCTIPIMAPKTANLIAQTIHGIEPKMLVAVGCPDAKAVKQIAQEEEIDILAVDDDQALEAAFQLRKTGSAKPIFDFRVHGHGGWMAAEDGKTLQGVWRLQVGELSPEMKSCQMAVERARTDKQYNLFAAFPAWTNGSERGADYQDHYEIGGSGTPQSPGFGWFLDMVDRARRPDREIAALDAGYELDSSWLPEAEREAGFKALFDGKSPQGWTVVPSNREWRIQDGVLYGPLETGTWIRSWRRYSDFILRLEVKLTEGCNSGVFLRAPLAARQSRNGIEMQLIGMNMDPQPNGPGSLYSYMAPRVDAFNKPGEWNDIEVEYRGRYIKVTINGQVVHDIDLTGHPIFGSRLLNGFIGFQAHGHGSPYFRNVRIKEL